MTKTGAVIVGVLAVALTGLAAYNLGAMDYEPKNVMVYGEISRSVSEETVEAESEAPVLSPSQPTASVVQQESSTTVSSEEAASQPLDPPAGGWNINTATVEQLLTVEGMTQSTAEEILRFRTAAGEFTAIEELRNVHGVSAALARRIAERFYCE